MKTLMITAAALAISATGAFAQSSALDVYTPEPAKVSAFDNTPTASIDGSSLNFGPRLGDGAPVRVQHNASGFDNTPTASIDGSSLNFGPRLGDGISH